jgi:hypothetical protein
MYGELRDPKRWRVRFGMKALLAVPLLCALLFILVDWWTGIRAPAQPQFRQFFRLVDAETGETIKQAIWRLQSGGLDEFRDMETDGTIEIQGPVHMTGHRSLVRDDRRIDFGDTRLAIDAFGYQPVDELVNSLMTRGRRDLDKHEITIPIRMTKADGPPRWAH